MIFARRKTVFDVYISIMLMQLAVFMIPMRLRYERGKSWITIVNGRFRYAFCIMFIGVYLMLFYSRSRHYLFENDVVDGLFQMMNAWGYVSATVVMFQLTYYRKDFFDCYKTLHTVDLVLEKSFAKIWNYNFEFAFPLIMTFLSIASAFVYYFTIIVQKTYILNEVLSTVGILYSAGQRYIPFVQLFIYSRIAITKLKFIHETLELFRKEDRIDLEKFNVLMQVHHLVSVNLSKHIRIIASSVFFNIMFSYSFTAIAIAGFRVLETSTLIIFWSYSMVWNIFLLVHCTILQKVNNQYDNVRHSLCMLDIRKEDQKLLNLKQLFLKQIIHDKIDNSVWGIFVMDHSFVLQMISNLSASAMFIFQIKPELLHK